MKKTYIIEFSGESPPLLDSMLKAAEDTWDDFEIVYRDERVVLVRGDIGVLTELSFVDFISEHIATINDQDDLLKIQLPEGLFHVRMRDYDGDITFNESKAGELLSGKGRISFSNPDFIMRIVKSHSIFVGIMVFRKDSKGINKRRSVLRPFFSPVSIHPKYARFMINLSRTHKGETILDPFCGTGGILLEAGLMGRKIIGSDSSLSMVRGARLNLKYFGLDGTVVRASFSELHLDSKVDAIVTDPPYGRSSPVDGQSVSVIHSSIYKKAHELLKTNGSMSIVVSDPTVIGYSEGFFRVLSVDSIRVHRSLTRHFYSLIKIE